MKELAYYQVKIRYLDGQDVNVPVSSDKLEEFLKHLSESKLYWSQKSASNSDGGFWTDIDKVRLLQISAVYGEEIKQKVASKKTFPPKLKEVAKITPKLPAAKK